MIITTTPSVEGRRITSYGGIVFGEVISGVNFARDIAASFTNFFGGRSRSYEEELTTAREQAIDEMTQRAARMGADMAGRKNKRAANAARRAHGRGRGGGRKDGL